MSATTRLRRSTARTSARTSERAIMSSAHHMEDIVIGEKGAKTVGVDMHDYGLVA